MLRAERNEKREKRVRNGRMKRRKQEYEIGDTKEEISKE